MGTEFHRTTGMFLALLENSKFTGLTFNGNTPGKSEFSSCELKKKIFFDLLLIYYLTHNLLYILRFDLLNFSDRTLFIVC